MKGATSALDAWQKLLAPSTGATCLNVSWENYCYGSPPAGIDLSGEEEKGQAAAAEAVSMSGRSEGESYRGPTSLANNGWDYLACTTEVHPIGSNNITDFLPPSPYRQDSVQDWCQGMYQTIALNDPNPEPHPTMVWMDAMQMPDGYPMPLSKELTRYIGSTSRIIWSSGSHDPWSSQSVNHSLSDTLLALMIEGGAHHSDLGGPGNPVPDAMTDLPSLTKAREFEIATLAGWVAEVKGERKAQLGPEGRAEAARRGAIRF